jgi:hypothetical protein
MVWLRWSPLVIAFAGPACSGSPTESQTGSDDDDDDDADDDDDDDDGDDDDDDDDDTGTTDPSGDPDSGPDEDTTGASDPDTGGTTDESSSDPSNGEDETSTGETSTPDCHPQLNEIAFDLMGEDDMLEWIAIANPCGDDIDMSAYSLGWGGPDYTYATQQLDGTLSADGCFVVGGPTSSQMNYGPSFAQSVNLENDLQNPDGTVADGIALFLGASDTITAESVPVDAVVYGESNRNNLLDENGDVATPAVTGSNDMQTIARTPEGWVVNVDPSPDDCTDPA